MNASAFEPLQREFFNRPADAVAVDLLGHFLLRRLDNELCGGLIVETEAYLSQNDASMWAYQHPRPRNQVLFEAPGFFFIYRVYRVHALLNVACREEGVAEAVLIRAIEPQFGEGPMRRNRPVDKSRDLTNGPSKLCQALNIDAPHNGIDACDAASPFFLGFNPNRDADCAQRTPRVTTTRIGLSRGGDLPLRFYLDGSDWVSKRLPQLPKTLR